MKTLSWVLGQEPAAPNLEAYSMLAARVLMSAIFLATGVLKIWDYSGFVAYASSHGVPFALETMWMVIVFELVAGICILLGLKTRAASISITIYVLILGPWFHQFWTYDWARDAAMAHIMMDDFFHHLTMAGGFIILAFGGPGEISLDGLKRPRNYAGAQ